MRKISNLAKKHKWAARFLIVARYLLVNYLGIISGIFLNDLSVLIPSSVFVFFILLFFTGLIIYPDKVRKEKNISRENIYRLQKSFDLILVLSTFVMVIYTGNHFKNPFTNFISARASSFSLPADSNSKKYKSIEAFKTSMKDADGNLLKWKERKKLLKEQVKAIKKSSDTNDGGKVVLIILSVLVAAGLLYLIAAASCSLSCSGADGAAILVGVGGTAAVVLLTILVIRSILRKSKKKKEMESNPKPETPGS